MINILFTYSLMNLYFIKQFGFPSFLDEILLIILLILGLRKTIIRKPHKILLLLIFVILILLGVLQSVSFYPAFRGTLDYFLPLFWVLAISLHFNNNYTKFYTLIDNFAYLTFIAVIIGLFVPSLGTAITYYSIDGPPSTRVGGFFYNPNTLGYFLVFFVNIAVFRYLKDEINVKKLSVHIALSLLLILLTSSRSSFVLYFISVSMIYVFSFEFKLKRSSIKKFVFMAFSLILAFYLTYYLVSNFSENSLLSRMRSVERILAASGRFNIWTELLNLHSFYPYTTTFFNGIGVGTLSRSGSEYVVVDSSHFKFLLELGLIKYVLLLFIAGFIIMINAWAMSKIDKALTYSLSLSMLSMMVVSEFYILAPLSSIYLFLIFRGASDY